MHFLESPYYERPGDQDPEFILGPLLLRRLEADALSPDDDVADPWQEDMMQLLERWDRQVERDEESGFYDAEDYDDAEDHNDHLPHDLSSDATTQLPADCATGDGLGMMAMAESVAELIVRFASKVDQRLLNMLRHVLHEWSQLAGDEEKLVGHLRLRHAVDLGAIHDIGKLRQVHSTEHERYWIKRGAVGQV